VRERRLGWQLLGEDVNRRVKAVLLYLSATETWEAEFVRTIARISKEHLAAESLRELWDARDSRVFVSR
jgi:hypothetical protein